MCFHKVTHRNHSRREQLFASFSKQRTGSTVAHWASFEGQQERSVHRCKQSQKGNSPDDAGTENYLTLNAEEVLPGMHGQTGLIAGRCQCCDITRKGRRHQNATHYQHSVCAELENKSSGIPSTSAPFCVSFPPHEVLS